MLDPCKHQVGGTERAKGCGTDELLSSWVTESVPETLNRPLPSTYPGPTTNTPEGAVHLSGAQHASAGGGRQEKELITPKSIKTSLSLSKKGFDKSIVLRYSIFIQRLGRGIILMIKGGN